jgi:hypothetical protein
MNTSNDKQPFKSSSFDTKNDQFGLEKPTKLSGYEQSANEALKLQLEDNTDTERCQENQGRSATHTTNVKIQSTSTPNQNKQQSIGNSISKDSVQQKLPKPKEFQELPSTGCSSLMDTNLESKNDFPFLFSTKIATPSSQVVITPEPIESDRYSTEMSGNTTMDKFPTDGMFITLMKTNKTTELKTLNASPKKNTLDITTQIEKQKRSEELIQAKSMPQQGKQRKRLDAQEPQSFILSKTEQSQQEFTGSTSKCLKCSTFSQELEVQASQETDWESRQPNLLKSIPMHSKSSDTTFPTFPSTTISELTIQPQENSILSGVHSHAREQATQEVEQDYLTQSQHFGEKDLDVLSKLNPSSVLSNNLKELSNEDFELFLVDSVWQDTVLKLKQSRQQSLGRVIKGSDYLSFPTLTSNENSTSRPAGQTKCEKWFKDNGLIPNGSQLSARAIASLMNFPTDWFSPLSPTKPQAESEPDILQDEQLPQPKQRSPSVESSICIPCLIKQPKQPEVKGVIKEDLGDRFVVEVDGEEIFISKLFVYPDFSKTVGQIEKSSSKTIPPSKNCSSKKRRQNGFGSGHIYYRTVTRNSKNYQQAYYQWRENGQQRTKYIPKKLLTRVEEAESLKLPVSDILVLLGGKDKCSSKKSDTFNNNAMPSASFAIAEVSEAEVINVTNECSSKVVPLSKSRRSKGKGTGWIECKPIKRGGKEYQQYWYHYEEWREGDRIIKKSRYIPKRLLARLEKLEVEKAPVREILEVLISKGTRSLK